MTDQDKKEQMKALRAERRESVERAKARVKETNAAIKKIKARLAEGSATVPELAEATGLTSQEALWYVAALKKYGQVVEGAKARGDSYYPYELAAETGGEEDPAPAA